jgi:hypothetical protein
VSSARGPRHAEWLARGRVEARPISHVELFGFVCTLHYKTEAVSRIFTHELTNYAIGLETVRDRDAQ